jgi:two-component system NtrC family response regulator
VLTKAYDEPIIYPYHLPVHIRTEAARASLKPKSKPPKNDDGLIEKEPLDTELALSFKEYRTQLLETGEKRYFTNIASLAQGNIKEACRISGLSKSRLYYFLQKHGITLSNPASTRSSES